MLRHCAWTKPWFDTGKACATTANVGDAVLLDAGWNTGAGQAGVYARIVSFQYHDLSGANGFRAGIRVFARA